MNVDNLRLALQSDIERVRAFGVVSLAVFGSVARGEAGPGSDVDLVVEFDGPATFKRYMGLKFLLEEILGRPVDLVTERSLKPGARRLVARDLVRVA